MIFSDIKTFINANLAALGYPSGYTRPSVHPGPTSSPDLVAAEPNAMIFVTIGGGAGTTVEQLYDRPFLVVRVIGAQEDYDGAEKLSMDIDRLFLSVGSPRLIGTARVLYIARAGAGPLLLTYDDGHRYSFQCNYITETVLPTAAVTPTTFSEQGGDDRGPGAW